MNIESDLRSYIYLQSAGHAGRFFESMPSCFMKAGNIDLDCVRYHIFQCLAALWFYETPGRRNQNLRKKDNLFYSAISELGASLAGDDFAADSANVLAKEFFLHTYDNFKPRRSKLITAAVSSADSSIINVEEEVLEACSDWSHTQWAVILQSVPCKQKLAIINEAAQEQTVESNPNATSRRKALLMHYAAASPSASIEVVKAVASPAAARCADARGRVPLHWAAMHSNSVDMIDYLLEEWPEATMAQDKDGYLPLHRLVSRPPFPERVAMIERLLRADPASCAMVTCDESSVLHFFCRSKRDNRETSLGVLTAILAAHPAAASQVNVFGRLPLHLVCENPFFEEKAALIESLLIAYPDGASVRTGAGCLPAQIEIRQCHDELSFQPLRILLDAFPAVMLNNITEEEGNCYDGSNTLIVAVKYSTPALKYILRNYPQLARASDSASGRLPLHRSLLAEGAIDLERIQLLCDEYPEALRMFSNERYLPLHCALRAAIEDPASNQAAVVRFLVHRYPEAVNMRRLPNGEVVAGGGAEPIQLNPFNGTPYQLMCSHATRSCEEIQRMLLRACPAADLQRLHQLNYNVRKQLAFLAFASRKPPVNVASGATAAAAGIPDDSSTKFIHIQLRRLMNIGEEMGLLRHIASYL